MKNKKKTVLKIINLDERLRKCNTVDVLHFSWGAWKTNDEGGLKSKQEESTVWALLICIQYSTNRY